MADADSYTYETESQLSDTESEIDLLESDTEDEVDSIPQLLRSLSTPERAWKAV